MNYDPMTNSCVPRINNDDDGGFESMEPVEFKWVEPENNFFEMSEEELGKIGKGEPNNDFNKKILGIGTALLGPAGLILGAINVGQQGKAIANLRAAAMVAEARGFDEIADTLRKRAEKAVGNSNFIAQGIEKFGGFQGVNELAQQIKFGSTDEVPIDPKALGLTEEQGIRIFQAASPPGMIYEPEKKVYVPDNSNTNPPGGGGTYVGDSDNGTPIYTPTPDTVRPKPRPSGSDNSPPPAAVAPKPKPKPVVTPKPEDYGSGSDGSSGGLDNLGFLYKGGLMKKRKKK